MNYKNLHITMTKKGREHLIEMSPAAMPVYTHGNACPYPIHACGTPYKSYQIEKNCRIKNFLVDEVLQIIQRNKSFLRNDKSKKVAKI